MNSATLSPDAARTETTLLRQLVDDMMTQRKELMDDVLLERKRDRRHKNVRFALIFGGIGLMLLSYLYVFVILGGGIGASTPSGPYAAVVQLKGPDRRRLIGQRRHRQQSTGAGFQRSSCKRRGAVRQQPWRLTGSVLDHLRSNSDLEGRIPRQTHCYRCHRYRGERRVFYRLGYRQNLR